MKTYDSASKTTTANNANNIGNDATTTAAIVERMTTMKMNKGTLALLNSSYQQNSMNQPQAPNVNKIPTLREKLQFESSLNRATSQVFHKSGLPLTSSPAPIRRSGLIHNAVVAAGRFDFDSSLIAKCSRGRAMGCPHLHGQRYVYKNCYAARFG